MYSVLSKGNDDKLRVRIHAIHFCTIFPTILRSHWQALFPCPNIIVPVINRNKRTSSEVAPAEKLNKVSRYHNTFTSSSSVKELFALVIE